MRPMVVIPEEDRVQLEMIRSSGLANKEMQTRASVILLAGQGYLNIEIAEKLHLSEITVSRWIYKYLEREPGTDLIALFKNKRAKGKNRFYSEEARAWLREYYAENPGISMVKYTERVHKNCAKAGFPELGTIARTSIATILKATDE